jgi:4-hydroxy-3-methylbut-2-enyl diphosphate reductase
VVERARHRYPELWTATRDDLCFATTNRQAALTAIASRADAVLVIGSANSSNTLALEKVARNVGCPVVQRINGVEELDEAALADARIVGVTAGASAPEDVVQAVIARLAPRSGVEEVDVTDEEEYFPPPRELRELLVALDTAVAVTLGAAPTTVSPFSDDRQRAASDVLDTLAAG